MKKLILMMALFILSAIEIYCQPDFDWIKTFGGSGEDNAHSLAKAMDGGYLLLGYTFSSDGDIEKNNGHSDILLIKVNQLGEKEWLKTYGGSGFEFGYCISPTLDGGFIVAGATDSDDGDISYIHSKDTSDVWILKLDKNGGIEKEKTFGGSKIDAALSIIQTNDGGYIFCGWTSSNDGDVSYCHSMQDLWVVKIDSEFNIEWERAIGGSLPDLARQIVQTKDGGFLLTGHVQSNDGDISGNHYKYDLTDLLVIKFSSDGKTEWQKVLGGGFMEMGMTAIESYNGTYLIGGMAESRDGDVKKKFGGRDIWLSALNEDGNFIWQETYGGNFHEYPSSIIFDYDSTYVIVGSTNSNDGEVTGLHSSDTADIWIIRINSEGKLLWQKTIGGTNIDYGSCVVQDKNGAYVIAGYTNSNDGDIMTNKGKSDFVLIRMKPERIMSAEELKNNKETIYLSIGKDKVNFEISESNHDTEILICNMMGLTIIKSRLSELNKITPSSYELYVASLHSGLYFIRIGEVVKKFVKI